MAGEVEHGNVEQPGAGEVEHIEDTADAAIAVGKGVDALELVVDERHLDQGVERAGVIVVNKALQRAHMRTQPAHPAAAHRPIRRCDRFSGRFPAYRENHRLGP